MAIALVGTIGAVPPGASGASVTPAFGQTTTAGNLLVAWVDANVNSGSASFPTAPSGWTALGNRGTQSNASTSFITRQRSVLTPRQPSPR